MRRNSTLRLFLQGFIEAAIWSSTATTDDGEVLEVLGEYEVARGATRNLCLPAARWFRRHWDALAEAAELLDGGQFDGWERVGHDAWLTSAGHGVGFWDRTELPKEMGERLSELSKELGCEHCCPWVEDAEIRFERLTLAGGSR